MKQFVVGADQKELRLDQYLTRLLPGAGKSFLYKMIRKKNITLNGRKAQGNERLAVGDEICIFFSDETFAQFRQPQKNASDHRTGGRKQLQDSETGNLSGGRKQPLQTHNLQKIAIVHEERDFLIADKPAGMLTQKASADDVSLNDWLLAYLSGEAAYRETESESDPLLFKPSVANRLDRNTSGMVLCSKTLTGARYLAKILKDRSLHKYYLAIVNGRIEQAYKLSGTLKKDEAKNQVKIENLQRESWDFVKEPYPFIEEAKQEQIHTAFRPLYYDDKNDVTLVEVLLMTGKSHQIRAHLAAAGHPLAGDPKYGERAKNAWLRSKFGINRQLLHCYKLIFPEDKQTFVCMPPKEFYQLTGDRYGNLEFPRTSGLDVRGYDQPHQ